MNKLTLEMDNTLELNNLIKLNQLEKKFEEKIKKVKKYLINEEIKVKSY